jgi:hypothetical protein
MGFARVRGWNVCAALVVAAAAGCSARDKPKPVSTAGGDVASVRAALTSVNGLAENGISTNGLWANGLWANGLWANGLWANGLWANGLWANGLWANGLWANGLWANGLWANGLWANGLWANGLTGPDAVPGNTLRGSRYARDLLQYLYACAMPLTTYDTQIDPGVGTCTLGGDVVAECGESYACTPDPANPAQGRCVVPLIGAIGLGINADGSSWGESGTCDESCQRWVSACVLARTNAYGAHVDISMRAPADAPLGRELQFARIQAALVTTAAEVADYSGREGAFYGNLFATTPVDPPPTPTFSGPATGPIASTPIFFACAGPASNIPALTMRFCSSQGNDSVIDIPGVCVTGTTSTGQTEAGACAGVDATGSVHGCYTTTSATARPPCLNEHDPTCFEEVITIYLKTPISVCGNDLCESATEDSTSCPNDCHPGTWSKTFNRVFAEQRFTGSSTGVTAAVNPDGTIVVAGSAPSPVNFGGAVDIPGGGGLGLAKLAADGSFLWGQKLSPNFNGPSKTDGVAVGSDGSIVVSGTGLSLAGAPGIWVGKFSADGNMAEGWPVVLTDVGTSNGTRVAVDGAGNVFVSLSAGSTTQGNYTYSNETVFGISADGELAWRLGLGLTYGFYAGPIAVDPNGDVFVAVLAPNAALEPRDVHIYKLSGADGGTIWDSFPANDGEASEGMLCALAVDPSGNVYASHSSVNGALDSGLSKFAAGNGQRIWLETISAYHPGAVCYGGHDFLAVAPDGTLIASWVFGGFYRTIADLGAGEFESYSTADVVIGGYASEDVVDPDLTRFRWAKHAPMVVQGQLDAMSLDGAGRVVLSGAFSGSMMVDGQFLVNEIPELASNANVYLASFIPPSLADATPPVIGVATDHTQAPLRTVPSDIYTLATSREGAIVLFLEPTATDSNNAGVNVACSPAPNSMFPIGITTVTCTASDPVGNRAVATFRVTVADVLGPVFSPITDPPPTPATNPGGATVAYVDPTATDQIEGTRPVTCVPASGSVFPVGSTTVTCTASDSSGNTGRTSFHVVVTPPPCTPALNPGVDQTVVGSCSSGPVAFTAPTLAASSCPGTTVACTPIPGDSYGAQVVTCTAQDASGTVSAPVSFTVTVLQPLTVQVQPPLIGNGGTVDNVVKRGSTVPVKARLFACGVNVTKTARVKVKLGVAYDAGDGTPPTPVQVDCDDGGDPGGVMKLNGANYLYNLSTKGYLKTINNPASYLGTINVAYKTAPAVIVGTDAIRLELK